jgi:hypothetical protein
MDTGARGTIEPIALSAGMAVLYGWLIGQQGKQPVP